MAYPLIDQPPTQNDLRDSVLSSIHQCASPLSNAFFSAVNIERIQTQLRIVVREKTGHVIDRQSDEQIVIVMRAMYVLYAYHGQDVEPEVRRLNAIVLSQLAPMVGTGVSQYFGYLRDASQMATPMERPKNMSVKGQNTFELFKG